MNHQDQETEASSNNKASKKVVQNHVQKKLGQITCWVAGRARLLQQKTSSDASFDANMTALLALFHTYVLRYLRYRAVFYLPLTQARCRYSIHFSHLYKSEM